MELLYVTPLGRHVDLQFLWKDSFDFRFLQL